MPIEKPIIPGVSTPQEIMQGWDNMQNVDLDDPNPHVAEKPAEAVKPAEKPLEKPVEKAAAAAPEKPVEDDDATVPRTAQDWKARKEKQKAREAAITKERDDTKALLESTRQEIEALKKSGPSPELDALKKERDELSERLRITKVTEHPKFKQYFNGKTERQIALAKTIVGGDQAEAVAKVLALPEGEYRDSQITDLMANLNQVQSTRLGGVLNALSEINQERDAAIANAQSEYETLTKREQEQQTQAVTQRKQAQEKAFDTIIKTAQDAKEGNPFFQKIEGNEAHNKEVDDRIALAKDLMFGQHNPESIAKAVTYAAMTPAVMASNISLREENKKLQEQIAALSAASPSMKTGAVGAVKDPADEPVVIKAGMRPQDISRAWEQRTNQMNK